MTRPYELVILEFIRHRRLGRACEFLACVMSVKGNLSEFNDTWRADMYLKLAFAYGDCGALSHTLWFLARCKNVDQKIMGGVQHALMQGGDLPRQMQLVQLQRQQYGSQGMQRSALYRLIRTAARWSSYHAGTRGWSDYNGMAAVCPSFLFTFTFTSPSLPALPSPIVNRISTLVYPDATPYLCPVLGPKGQREVHGETVDPFDIAFTAFQSLLQAESSHAKLRRGRGGGGGGVVEEGPGDQGGDQLGQLISSRLPPTGTGEVSTSSSSRSSHSNNNNNNNEQQQWDGGDSNALTKAGNKALMQVLQVCFAQQNITRMLKVLSECESWNLPVDAWALGRAAQCCVHAEDIGMLKVIEGIVVRRGMDPITCAGAVAQVISIESGVSEGMNSLRNRLVMN